MPTKEEWEERARKGEHAVEVYDHPLTAFCLEHGHIRSLGYNGPRFVCLACHHLYDRDPGSDEVFIKPPHLPCACGSTSFEPTKEFDRGLPLIRCKECGILCR